MFILPDHIHRPTTSHGPPAAPTITSRDMTAIAIAIAIMTAAGWYGLATWAPAALAFLCGADGLYPLVGQWDLGRLAALLVMWGAMTCIMMLPCVMVPFLDIGRTFPRGQSLQLAVVAFSSGYVFILMLIGGGGAITQWAFESAGAMSDGSIIENHVLRLGVLAMSGLFLASRVRRDNAFSIGCIEIQDTSPFASGLRHGQSRFAACASMVCLQLAGGAMNLSWAAILAVWMFADALLPRGRTAAGSMLLFAILTGLLLITL